MRFTFNSSIYKFCFVCFIFIIIVLALFLPGILPENNLIIGGSTSVSVLFTRLKALSIKKNLQYKYNSMGSSAALKRVKDETFLVGFMSKKPPPLPANFQTITLVKDAVIFVYHLPKICKVKNNSNLNFTKSTLKNIFMQKQADWSLFDAVTCSQKSNESKIYRINRENGSGTRSVFEKKLGLKGNYHFESTNKKSNTLLKNIEKKPGSLAYFSFSYFQRINELHSNDGNINYAAWEGVVPTYENIFIDQYNFYRPFVGLYLKKNVSKLQNFFQFLQSKAAKNIIRESGFIYDFK